MITIADLVRFYRNHMAACEEEIDNAVQRYNANVNLQEADMRQVVDTWRAEFVVARDTVAYLETLASIQRKTAPLARVADPVGVFHVLVPSVPVTFNGTDPSAA